MIGEFRFLRRRVQLLYTQPRNQGYLHLEVQLSYVMSLTRMWYVRTDSSNYAENDSSIFDGAAYRCAGNRCRDVLTLRESLLR